MELFNKTMEYLFSQMPVTHLHKKIIEEEVKNIFVAACYNDQLLSYYEKDPLLVSSSSDKTEEVKS